MDERNLAGEFETHRDRLRAVAYRMLGTGGEADDAVQEAWLRLSRAGAGDVENLGGWLTTVVARVCLDILRSRRSRREESLDAGAIELPSSSDAEHETLLADSVGPALLVVLDALAPAERVAFVLHDLFAVSFDEIARILGRSSVAVRQLASRARRRVQGREPEAEADPAREREVVEAFLAASREGDMERLVALLDPNVVLRADAFAVQTAAERRAAGAPAPALAPEVRGPSAVAQSLAGRARGAQLALIDGTPGATWAPGGQPRAVFAFTVSGGKIVEIEILLDPESVRHVDVEIL
jgi:RNA polymerase sigma-70 factor (ECF subfamily)